MKRLAILTLITILCAAHLASANVLTGDPAADGWSHRGHSLENGVYVRGNGNVGYEVYTTLFTVTDSNVFDLSGHDAAGYLDYYEMAHWTKGDARPWQVGDPVIGIGGVFSDITPAEAGWSGFTGNPVNSTIDSENRLRLQAKIGTALATWSVSAVAPDQGDGSGSTSDGGSGTVFLRTSGWHDLQAWEDFAGQMLGLQKTSHIDRSGTTINVDAARVIWTWDDSAQRPATWQLLINTALVDADAEPGFIGLLPEADDLVVGSVQVANGPTTDSLGMIIAATPAINEVSVSSAVDCVNDAGTCTDLTVTFNRTDTAASRGVSTTLQLSPELELCDTGNLFANFTLASGAGAWADGYTNTTMQVYDNGGGNYTVDMAILGNPCGPTTGGDLFTIAVKPATGFAGEAIGTVSVTDVLVRDCANAPLPGVPGAAGEVAIDLVAPVALADLTAAQVKTGNDSDGDTEIALSWTAPGGDADLIEIWRKGHGDYPEYDAGSTPAAPVTLANGWTLVATVDASDPPTYVDAPGSRDFWTYAAYVIDGCGNYSPVSALTGGTLSYHLGDVTDGAVNGNGDNLVTTNDLSHLGANYGISLVPGDALNYLDVGPTTDFSVDALPTTDDQVQFEDLMMFAINYDQVSKDLRAPQPAPVNAIELLAGEAVAVGGTFEVALRLQADGRMQGVSVPLTWDAQVVEPVGMRAGDLMAEQGGAVLVASPAPGVVDAAIMGVRGQGISGDGVLAWVSFRVKASGEPRIAVGEVMARDAENQQVLIAGAAGVETPALVPEVSSLAPNAPNPFNPATELRFSVARDGQVQLRVYNLRGSLVRTLVNEPRAAGHHAVVWNGTDDAGRTVASGSYVVQLVAPDGNDSRHITLVK